VTDLAPPAPLLGRVCKKAEYDRVFRLGAKAWDRWLTVWVAPGADPGRVRLGTAVSKRIGNAVRRNRVRRRFRAAFRQVAPALPAGLDLVVLPSSRLRELDPRFDALCDSLGAVTRRALSKLAARERAQSGGRSSARPKKENPKENPRRP